MVFGPAGKEGRDEVARRMEDYNEVMGLPPAALEDKHLALAYQAGEKGAYQAIYDRYSVRVNGVCRRMLGPGPDAQDAAQEAFLRVYQALGRFNGRYQLGAWITRITTNVCLDHLRARSRRPAEVVQIEAVDPQEDRYCDQDGPEGAVLRNAEGRRVRKVLSQLPPLHRAAIVLRDFEGLSYQEVAIALNLSESQVKALIHRARQGFKRSWATTALSAILPTRLFARGRKVSFAKEQGPCTPAHQLAESVSAAAAPAASSCSAVLAHCGQFVAERMAPMVAAMAVGAASVAVPVVANDDPPAVEAPAATSGTPLSSAEAGGAGGPSARAEGSRRPAGDASDERAGESGRAPAGPEEAEVGGDAPAAPPAPAPSPSGSPTEPPAQQPADPPAAEPEPEGFGFSFASDLAFGGASCDCLGPASVRHETTTASDEAGLVSFEQSIAGTATAGGSPAYGLQLQHAGEPYRPYSAVFVLSTREGDYRYDVQAPVVSRERTSWGGWSYLFEGTYELGSRPGYRESVPQSGRYSARVLVSTKQQRIVSVGVGLFEH